MAGSTKAKTVYVCRQCGFESIKWNGRCPNCGEWNSLEETQILPEPKRAGTASRTLSPSLAPMRLEDVARDGDVRYHTGAGELDRVLGGGLVKGSLVLLGGDPGIGKSTLLLQICRFMGEEHTILYVSGEESARQIKLRAERLGVASPNLYLVTLTDAEEIALLVRENKPDIVIIDSIQTMSIGAIASTPGSITQVRECTNLFMRLAKSGEIPIFLVGHVNKDGAIAGPKVMEHIVDTVLYFEGERHLSYRILRSVKNRYGSTNEIGVFEMCDDGLRQVENPSMMLLSGRPAGVSGTCVVCTMEGSRPILAEVQALVTKTSFGTPRRMATGFDYNRMSILIAVLEKRAGFFFGNLDVYINVVGGLRLDEPAADLAVALALYSGLRDKPLDERLMAFGEIGLGGELRGVSHIAARLREGSRLGFTKCILPKQALGTLGDDVGGIDTVAVSSLKQAFSALLGDAK